MGRMTRLDNLEGLSNPVRLFQSIPTVGPVLAQRIHHRLQVGSLESLENTFGHDQLKKVEGLGQKRKEAIKLWLSKHLGEHKLQSSIVPQPGQNPDISLLLKVDAKYKEKFEAGLLPTSHLISSIQNPKAGYLSSMLPMMASISLRFILTPSLRTN